MLTIRAAAAQDYDVISRLLAELDAIHAAREPSVFRPAAPPARSKEYLDGLLSDPTVGLFIAEADSMPVGLVHLQIRHAPDYSMLVPRTYAHMEGLVVTEGARGIGVGKALVGYAEKWSLAHGCTKMQLGVWEFNSPAIAFYERSGYRTFARRMWKDLL